MRLAEWWQMVIARDGFFYPILTKIMDSFSCSPLNTSFHTRKTWKSLPENPEYTEMPHSDVVLTLQWPHRSTCCQRAAVHFLSFPQAGMAMRERIKTISCSDNYFSHNSQTNLASLCSSAVCFSLTSGLQIRVFKNQLSFFLIQNTYCLVLKITI